jgi:hypothetical protein
MCAEVIGWSLLNGHDHVKIESCYFIFQMVFQYLIRVSQKPSLSYLEAIFVTYLFAYLC